MHLELPPNGTLSHLEVSVTSLPVLSSTTDLKSAILSSIILITISLVLYVSKGKYSFIAILALPALLKLSKSTLAFEAITALPVAFKLERLLLAHISLISALLVTLPSLSSKTTLEPDVAIVGLSLATSPSKALSVRTSVQPSVPVPSTLK